ncbi:MAG: glycosyltransferase [Desulfovibrionaceae bacterium]
MNVLFVHQNFPGQYKYLMPYLARTGHNVIALGEECNIKDIVYPEDLSVRVYPTATSFSEGTHHYLRSHENNIRRGQNVLRICMDLRTKEGFIPDLICVHTGWGEALFLRDVFPHAKIIAFCEYFYDRQFLGKIDVPHFEMDFDSLLRFRSQNTTQLVSSPLWDWGITPTEYQWKTYPDFLRNKISIVHDGIDTESLGFLKKTEPIVLPSGEKIHKDTDVIITYVSRNLEPYRGYHNFVHAIPKIQKALPHAHIVIIGGDGVSYGRSAPDGKTYREIFMKEIEGSVDLSKVHYMGRLSYNKFINVLYNSHVHTYLTYPFVLSWSMIESMAMGLLLVASDTASVTEVVQDGYNGILCDFYDPNSIAEKIIYAHNLPEDAKNLLREHARETAMKKYDLRSHCIPKQLELINILMSGGIPKHSGLL